MRYFMIVKPPREFLEGKATPPEALMQAMGPYMRKSIEDGSLISTAGLRPMGEAISVTASEGRIAVVDGPFSESKELIGGYAVMELPSREAAIQAATDFINLHIENGMPDIEVVVRPIEAGYNY